MFVARVHLNWVDTGVPVFECYAKHLHEMPAASTSRFFAIIVSVLLAFSTRRPLSLLLLMTSLALDGSKTVAAESRVSVLYAGSLGNLMEIDLGPAFSRATGYKYVGEAKGSLLSANLIKEQLRTPDVFISADPKVNLLLMGPANGNLVRWYATIFGNELVLGYHPHSRFADQLRQLGPNDIRAYVILQQKGFRLGRGDPELEPKGYRTLFLFDLAEKYYRQPGLAMKILHDPDHPTLIFPEEQLVARLEAGQLDAGIFYRNEIAEHNLPSIAFPRELNLSDPALDSYYSSATYMNRRGVTYSGSPIVYSVTIPEHSQNRDGAIALVSFLFGDEGRKIVEKHALRFVQPLVCGDIEAAPSTLQTALKRSSSR
jgi:molybdate/tungstate transport system substrate-binding protein